MKQAGMIWGFTLIFSLPVFATMSFFVTVPAGTLKPFWLKPEKGQIIYRIPALEAQRYQVTNEDYIQFLRANPEWRKSQISPLFAEGSYLEHFQNDLELKPGFDQKSPVTAISWFAARAYCESLNARLPTVAEWEYLAAADEKKPDANKEPKFLERILNWYGQTKTDLPRVGTIYRNLYGIHDAHGLVWEWVEDFNSSTSTGESREDSSLNRDLFCGAGSMNAGDKENYSAFMRFAFRGSLTGKSTIWNLGFRCVKGTKI